VSSTFHGSGRIILDRTWKSSVPSGFRGPTNSPYCCYCSVALPRASRRRAGRGRLPKISHEDDKGLGSLTTPPTARLTCSEERSVAPTSPTPGFGTAPIGRKNPQLGLRPFDLIPLLTRRATTAALGRRKRLPHVWRATVYVFVGQAFACQPIFSQSRKQGDR
jgi:hypothetical protein